MALFICSNVTASLFIVLPLSSKKPGVVPSLFQATVAIILVIPSDLFTLIDFFSFCTWMFYGFSMVSLLVLRWKRPDLDRPFRVGGRCLEIIHNCLADQPVLLHCYYFSVSHCNTDHSTDGVYLPSVCANHRLS